MKKNLLKSLLAVALLLVCGNVWGEEATITFSELGLTNGEQYTDPFESGNVNVTFAGGDNDGKYYTTGSGIRTYGDGTITISVNSEYIISKIALTFSGASYAPADAKVWSSDGDGAGTSGVSATWTGSATSVVLTRPTGSGHWRLQKVEVTYASKDDNRADVTMSFSSDTVTVFPGETFTAPTLTVDPIEADSEVSFSSRNTAVATVTATGAVTIKAAGTTTITASIVGSEDYKDASASYTLNVGNIFANLQELQAGTTTTSAFPMKVTLTNVQVTGVNGKNAYINDGTYGAIIYTDGHGLAEGQIINGTLTASSQLYNGAPEITEFSSAGLTIIAGTLSPQVKAIGDLSVANEGIYVTIKGLTYNASEKTFSDGTSTIAYYDGLKKEVALEDGANYDVTGVVNYRNSLQLFPTSVDKLAVDVATPQFSKDEGSYKGSQTITLTQKDNLPIYYTIDDTDPTTSETAVEYTQPITITKTTPIKAAAKDGDTWSNVVTHTYTIIPLYANIALLKDAITATSASEAVDMYVTLKDAVVTYINGQNYYIEDETAGILIYNNSQGVKDKLTNAGLKLNGDMKAAGYIYNGLYELTKNFDFSEVTTTSEGVEIPLTVVTLAELNADLATYESRRVKVVNATVTSKLASRKATITQETESLQIYEKISGTLAESALATENARVTVVGYPGINNETKQLNVWEPNDVTMVEVIETYADLPFAFDGGKANIEGVDGLTQNGLGTDYKNSPKLKFDDTGDYLILHFNESPGKLTYDIKGNSFSGGTFKVQTSVDGVNYSDLKTYSTITDSIQSEVFKNLGDAVRYIKWIYTAKSSGNVALGNISLAKYAAPVNYTLSIGDPEFVIITANYGEEVLQNGDEAEVLDGTEITLALNINEGYDLESLTVVGDEGQTVTLTQEETVWTFNMPEFNVTVNASVVEHVEPVLAYYTLATAITPGKRYVFASGKVDDVYDLVVMAEQGTNNRRGKIARVVDGKLEVPEGLDFVIEGNATDGYTIYDDSEESRGYLYAASSSSNWLKTQTEYDANGKWTIEINEETGEATIIAQGENTRKVMRYNPNNGSPLFSCYESNTPQSQSPVYLFQLVEETPSYETGDVNEDHEVNVSDVTMLVSMILGNTPVTDAADVNEDHEVNVSDVTALVSIILGQ